MRKVKLALTALMIGTLTVTGASFAEANVLDSVNLILNIGTEKKTPPHAERPEQPPRQQERKPAPKPVMTHEPQHGSKEEPKRHEALEKRIPQPHKGQYDRNHRQG